ncbi:MAG: hypothetical protein II349_03365, partial [Akkermansia sp.]|nr:hypothetical protein [Akkermansia sp.]
MPEPKNNKPNGIPPMQPSNQQPNWGLWILMAVIAGILLLAFMFDGSMGGSARSIKLDEFQKDYRNGLIVLTQSREYPIEVVTSSGGSQGTITAYKYRVAPKYDIGKFYMPFTSSEEIKALCNRYGITATQVDAPTPAPD